MHAERACAATVSAPPADASSRRMFFRNATEMLRLTKGKHVIISRSLPACVVCVCARQRAVLAPTSLPPNSGARHPLELRGLADVCAVFGVMGLSREATTACMTTHCRSVIEHSKRRAAVGGVLVLPTPFAPNPRKAAQWTAAVAPPSLPPTVTPPSEPTGSATLAVAPPSEPTESSAPPPKPTQSPAPLSKPAVALALPMAPPSKKRAPTATLTKLLNKKAKE